MYVMFHRTSKNYFIVSCYVAMVKTVSTQHISQQLNKITKNIPSNQYLQLDSFQNLVLKSP